MLIILQKKIKSISIIDAIKIGIIILVSFTLLTNIIPYYSGGDDYDIAIAGINLAKGSYGVTNELWQKTGGNIFVPQHWFETEQDVLVPVSSPGIIVTSALSYLIGGYYGLFYLGPLFSILFLIISERVATKLFGGFVGLFTLVLLGSDLNIFQVGIELLTDNIFSVFFILGVFYLITFLRSKKEKFILISSIFFVTAAFFRFNGLIFLPIEVSLVVGYFIFQNISTSRRELTSKNFLSKISLSKINSKKILKISALMILPWIAILSFNFTFNDYYFGSPLITYYSFWGLSSEYLLDSFFIFDFERFDSIKSYSIVFLPDLLGTNLLNSSLEIYKSILTNFLSIFSFFIFGIALLITLLRKSKRTEIIIFIPFVLGLLLFYSSDYSISIGQADRFMIPTLPLTFTIFGFILHRIYKIILVKFSGKQSKMISTSFRKGSVILLAIFLFASFLISPSFQEITRKDFIINPKIIPDRYPLDPEGLTEHSIIVENSGKRALEYNAIPHLPVKGSWFIRINELDPTKVPILPILNLQRTLDEGYEAYTFKFHNILFQPLYFRYLESEHGIILQDYSKTFCKMVIIENIPESSEEEIESDDICYMYRGKVVPKN